MDVRPFSRRALAVAVAGLVGLLSLAACGSSSTSSSSGGGGGSASGGGSVANEVPAAIKSKGTLVIAADASYAPNEFVDTDGTTVIGMDADLAKALGQVMGLNVSVQNVKFDNIIPGLASGKYDLGMSSFTDTKDREKTVDFVTYFSAGTSFFVKASGGPTINSLDDLCGHNASVEKGTTQLDDATAQDGKCKAANKQGVNVLSFDDQNGANLALSSGRADVSMADSPVAAYQVKQSNGTFKISGQPYGTAPYGIAIPKANGMAQVVLDGIKLLMSNGTYKQILDKWGIADGAISNPAINGATS
jgi:polar amino acid transport system substrate-binding protein